MHPGLQFVIFIAIFIGVLIIGNLIGAGLVIALYGSKTLFAVAGLKVSSPHLVSAIWILQFSGTTFPILAAPVFFAYVIVREPQRYLKANIRFHWGLLALVLLIMFFSNPIIELLSNINAQMKLPPFLKGLEDWMKSTEKSAEEVTTALLKMNSIGDMLKNVLFIGLIPGIVEELMFRGVLQTIFLRWSKNTHAAVWITAALFSAFHFEFYGFLPRLMLGVLFGYFVAWSGSIWPAIWAHFLNNGTDVVITYLYQHKQIKINPDDQHIFNYTGYVISFAVLVVLMLIYRRNALERNTEADY